jgi:hypothetical protein
MDNPQIASGTITAGAIFATSTDLPGTISLRLIPTQLLSGSGDLATLSFDLLGSSPGEIISMSTSIVHGVQPQPPTPPPAPPLPPQQPGTSTPPLTGIAAQAAKVIERVFKE